MTLLGKDGDLGGGMHLEEANYLECDFRGRMLSLNSLCLASFPPLKFFLTCATSMMLCLTLHSKQWASWLSKAMSQNKHSCF